MPASRGDRAAARDACRASGLALLWLLGVSAAHATPYESLETIQVTATRRAEPAFEVPNATTIATRQDIVASAPQTAMDALRREAGMYVQQTTPGQGSVIVRGLKGSEVLHVVDGFRLNNAIFRNAPTQYVALVDSQSLERIEAVRGPMSALYGSDAMGGVVQMLTAEPGFQADSWDATGLLRSAYGTADDSTLSRIEGAAGRVRLALSGGYSYQDVDQRRTGDGEVLAHTGFTARAGDAKVRAELAEGHELTLSYQSLRQPRTPRYDELTPGYGQSAPASSIYWFAPQQRDLVQLRWRGSRANAFWDTAEARVGRQSVRDDRETSAFGSTTLDRERNRDVTTGVTFQALKESARGHHLTWGADVYEDDVSSSRWRSDLAGGAKASLAPRFPDGSTMSQYGVFVADDWSPADRLDAVAALRISHVRTRLPRSGGADGVTVDDTGWTGNLGVAYAVHEHVRLVTNLGRGFRAPNVFDLGTLGDRPGNRFNLPNPDLEPETITTLDAGAKWLAGRAEGELVAYRSWYRDRITSVLTGAVTESGRLVVRSENAARLDLWGIEFATRHRVTAAVELYGTATWTRGDEQLGNDTTPADRIPPLAGTVGVLWRPSPELTFDAYAVIAAEQERYSPRDEADPRIKPGGTPGWTTWNARVAWEPSPRVSAQVMLTNLADHHYREFGSGIDGPGFGARFMIELRL
jgi:hemoglobin/transferrin/lactoferrin receptor protein